MGWRRSPCEEAEPGTSLLHETRLGLRAAAGMRGHPHRDRRFRRRDAVRQASSTSRSRCSRQRRLDSSDSGFALLVGAVRPRVHRRVAPRSGGRRAAAAPAPLPPGGLRDGPGLRGLGQRRPGWRSPWSRSRLAGFGNGLLLVHERLLIQAVVPEHLQGRVFAVSDTVVSWAFAIAFLGAGPLLDGARRERDDRHRRRRSRSLFAAAGDVRASQRVDRVPPARRGTRDASLRSGADAPRAPGRSASIARMWSVGGASAAPVSMTRSIAATTSGSNCVPAFVDQLVDRLLVRERRAVGAVGGHRVVGVADEHDASGERDLLARAGRRGSPCRPSARGRSARSRRRARAGRRSRSSMNWPSIVWVFITSNSLVGERGRLVQDLLRDRDLADVVEQRGELELLAARTCRCRSPPPRRGPARPPSASARPCSRRRTRRRRPAASRCRGRRGAARGVAV